MTSAQTFAVFGQMLEAVLNRPLTLEARLAALESLASLAEILEMQVAADAATTAGEAVRALDTAQLRLFDAVTEGTRTV